MPGKRKDKEKANPIPLSKPKGVLEIIVPVKNTEVKSPVMYDYFKNNASYSEFNDNTVDEETKLLKLQIEKRLNEILPVPYELNPKTKNESTTACVEDKKKSNRKSTDVCLLFSKALSQITGAVKKPEKEAMFGVVSKPKRDILVPLEKVKKDEDYFKGTKNPKEKKVKPKKQVKVVCFDSHSVSSNPAPVIETPPVIANRWHEKEGSKLFTREEDEEEQMLQLAIKESLKVAKMEKERQIQEELLYQELTREAKKSRYEGRGSKIHSVIKNKSWDAFESGAKSCDQFDYKVEGVKSIPQISSSWDDEIDLVREEIERKAKKERVKKSLKEKLKYLNNYGPLPDDETEESVVVKKKEETKEKIKIAKKIEGELVEDLEFVDVNSDDEEKEVKVSHDWSLPEKEIQQSVTKKSDISLEKKKKKKENLIFNDIEESDYEMETFKNEKPKPKSHNRDPNWNSSSDVDIRGLPPRSQRPANERRKPDTKSPEVNDNIFQEPNLRTVPKGPLWNSSAKTEDRGFSKEYQAKRNANKNTKSNPSKNNFEIFSPKDIPQLNEEAKITEGPFQDFEINMPKAELNDLNGNKKDVPGKEFVDSVTGDKVIEYMVKILSSAVFQQECEKISALGGNQTLLKNFQQVPNVSNLNNFPLSDLAQQISLQQGLNLSNLLSNPQQANSLNLLNLLNLLQTNGMNLPNMANVQQSQIPNLNQTTGLNLGNLLNSVSSQQISSGNLQNMGIPQQFQVPNTQQTNFTLPNSANNQQEVNLADILRNLSLQQPNNINLPNMESVLQGLIPNTQQAPNLNFPDLVNHLQHADNLNLPNIVNNLGVQQPNEANPAKTESEQENHTLNLQQVSNSNLSDLNDSEDCQTANQKSEKPPVAEEEPPASFNKIEMLNLKIIKLERELAKEKEEKEQLAQTVELKNKSELVPEEQTEEELVSEEQPMEDMMMSNPYLYQQPAGIQPPRVYPNQMPLYYPIIPPASHVPLPPWVPPHPYMGPIMFPRPPFHMQGPR